MEFKNLPVLYNMTAIENVMKSANMDDFSAFGEKMEFVKSLKFARDCAYYGLQAGCKKAGIEMPYKSSEDLGDDIDSFEDLNPCVEEFTKAVADFFQPKSQKTKAQ